MNVDPSCDVVILSNASNPRLAMVTQNAIDSLLSSETPGTFNITVMEQSKQLYQGANVKRLPGDFNYNQFANIGIRSGSAPWICVANNDLNFTPGWFTELMWYQYDVMSPKSPTDKRQKSVRMPESSWTNGRHFSGWCFVMKRSLFERIGGLDEDFPFWCADNAFLEQIKGIGVVPVLIPGSIVVHTPSTTLKTLDTIQRNELTVQQVKKFNRKYHQNLFNLGV